MRRETPLDGKFGAGRRELWRKQVGSAATLAAKVKGLFETFGLDTKDDILSVALVLQSAGRTADSAENASGAGILTGHRAVAGDNDKKYSDSSNVESLLYNAHWKKDLLADCAVTGEGQVIGAQIELTHPANGTHEAVQAATMMGGRYGGWGKPSSVVHL
jgi:hypothetical protein